MFCEVKTFVNVSEFLSCGADVWQNCPDAIQWPESLILPTIAQIMSCGTGVWEYSPDAMPWLEFLLLPMVPSFLGLGSIVCLTFNLLKSAFLVVFGSIFSLKLTSSKFSRTSIFSIIPGFLSRLMISGSSSKFSWVLIFSITSSLSSKSSRASIFFDNFGFFIEVL